MRAASPAGHRPDILRARHASTQHEFYAAPQDQLRDAAHLRGIAATITRGPDCRACDDPGDTGEERDAVDTMRPSSTRMATASRSLAIPVRMVMTPID